MKPIKFDLPLNGTRIATLDELEKNLTPEIFESFRSGKLVKWLRVRKLNEQAGAVEALLVADIQDEVELFKKLCEIFVSNVNEDRIHFQIEMYKTFSEMKAQQAERSKQLMQMEASIMASIERFKSIIPIKEKYNINQNLLKKLPYEGYVYITDSIPKQKLKNAIKTYGKFGVKNEKPIVLFDETFWGSSEDGLLLTELSLCCQYSPYSSFFTRKQNAIKLADVRSVEIRWDGTDALYINKKEFVQMMLSYDKMALRKFADFLKDYLALSDENS